MNSFSFVGTVPSSKSIYNRVLIARSYFPELEVTGLSQCDDVVYMRKALFSLMNGLPIDCGAAGTVLRFVALRAARMPGEYTLLGTQRLMSRLPEALITLLRQLGSEVQLEQNKLHITSRGWKVQGDGLYVSSDKSSQFASSVLLNSWELEKPLQLSFGRNIASRGYLDMTFELMRSLGFVWEDSEEGVYIPADQGVNLDSIDVELDMSSAFCLAVLAALNGEARIQNFPINSYQPDRIFPQILSQMNVPVDFDNHCLKVGKSSQLLAVQCDLSSTPDLFPVLSVLCAFAEGESHLYGATHLKYKESQRIEKTSELLQKIDIQHEVRPDGLKIIGNPKLNRKTSFTFDTDEDHRLAMAAGILKQIGFNIEIINKSVVQKSFPEFWDIIGE